MKIPPDDFTVFYRKADPLTQKLLTHGPLQDDKESVLSDEVQFTFRSTSGVGCVCKARALGCWCWRREAFSITLRVYERDCASSSVLDLGEIREALVIPAQNPAWPVPHGKKDPEFLFSETELTDVLFPALFTPELEGEPGDPGKVIRRGLVVISGQTGSLKSTVLENLVKKYLMRFDIDAWGKPGRHPHVISLDQPIEKPLMKLTDSLAEAKVRLFDYTPREIGKDVPDLESGLMIDALRQTPAVVVVGETRNELDWASLLHFAATGHLCITTCHAGSLVETMRKIIEATKATTPDMRSSLVEKLVGVTHLQKFSLPGMWPCDDGVRSSLRQSLGEARSMLLPAVWRNAPSSSNFFVSDGLGAILPRRRDSHAPASCRGRLDFADAMLTEDHLRPVSIRVRQLAARSDLLGI